MSGLAPFFPYYGSKWRSARGYPPPMYAQIVEPFAGSAGYSLRYPDRDVLLVELDPRVAEVWRFLIDVTPDEIMALPDVPPGATVDDVGMRDGPGRWLVGFHLRPGETRPALRNSPWAVTCPHKGRGWHAAAKSRIVGQLPRIRHWRVVEGGYELAAQEIRGPSTWFIDPPYSGRPGRKYRTPRLDYAALGDWCRTLTGQVIVCEAAGADWLPFRAVWETRGIAGRSREAVWLS